jgi:hypothetical protein
MIAAPSLRVIIHPLLTQPLPELEFGSSQYTHNNPHERPRAQMRSHGKVFIAASDMPSVPPVHT